MENITAVFETMLNSFTDADQLMDFAATWGIQDSPALRLRLFQLRNTVYEDAFVDQQLNTILQTFVGTTEQGVDDFELALQYVRKEDEVEELIKALLFDEEMEALGQTCVDDGEWSPTLQVDYF